MDDENAGSYAAFPVVSADHVYASGMSLRDWFAGQTLMGIGAWNPGPNALSCPALDDPDTLMRRAKFVYAQADAMLKARGMATPNTTAKEG